ncbi:MAG: hypothetical protein EOQ86_19690 [Mesorhizobium sp.]|uniref:hypothetical protein n=1 Tax=Mesorhizobium sp. TaxID=1871066 RepID=UPI000FE79F72|nr:hypothetical protein [Mesorhizobium sp.]RWH76853.1 MAG: hypothetical protein EOQ85_20160 [Mesorhizobium sp.]RWH80162.1 MAG: hypothetical protein EOQ86_19690 [Mesorhizobium sp.]RWH88759.1 MAG: hypothetical protein EOQ87_20390 [Mesorhizobium sp.]RWH95616.1 MAG: hypothetical protein EOQ88_22520 [Mesorhizobium sp.]RWI01301.1 MAG: hypothetical protein EOQ89_16730 [Mesorhizobium sp.]
MSASMHFPPFRRRVTLTHGYEVEFAVGSFGLSRKWYPACPVFRSRRAGRRFLEAYRKARADFLRDLATMLGGPVVVADTEGEVAVVEPETRQ